MNIISGKEVIYLWTENGVVEKAYRDINKLLSYLFKVEHFSEYKTMDEFNEYTPDYTYINAIDLEG